ncbi:MAG: hypothetical protein DMF77_12365 [Acidobacteria bacterium]|nr:MAG: hypothetical protein DMF77_12365 [Acidobacteriota bacterium]
MTPDLVVLGNLLVDDMVFPDGRTRMAEPGGATLYAALGASLWGLPAGVASVRGDDYQERRKTMIRKRASGIFVPERKRVRADTLRVGAARPGGRSRRHTPG